MHAIQLTIKKHLIYREVNAETLHLLHKLLGLKDLPPIYMIILIEINAETVDLRYKPMPIKKLYIIIALIINVINAEA